MMKSENTTPAKLDAQNLDVRRKRIWFRCHHMGMHENDIIVGSFADRYIAELTEEQLDRFEALIAENDIDLLNWIIGRAEAPAEHDNDMLKLIQIHKNTL